MLFLPSLSATQSSKSQLLLTLRNLYPCETREIWDSRKRLCEGICEEITKQLNKETYQYLSISTNVLQNLDATTGDLSQIHH